MTEEPDPLVTDQQSHESSTNDFDYPLNLDAHTRDLNDYIEQFQAQNFEAFSELNHQSDPNRNGNNGYELRINLLRHRLKDFYQGFNKLICQKPEVKLFGRAADSMTMTVNPMLQSYVAIRTANRRGPLALKVAFKRGCEGDLALLVGTKEFTDVPSAIWSWRNVQDSQTLILNPKTCYQTALASQQEIQQNYFQTKKWQPEVIFLTFQSQQGCQFDLKHTFVHELKEAKRRAQQEDLHNDCGKGGGEQHPLAEQRDRIQHRVDCLWEERDGLDKIKTEVERMKLQLRLRNSTRAEAKDFIRKNISQTRGWERKQQLLHTKSQSKDRLNRESVE